MTQRRVFGFKVGLNKSKQLWWGPCSVQEGHVGKRVISVEQQKRQYALTPQNVKADYQRPSDLFRRFINKYNDRIRVGLLPPVPIEYRRYETWTQAVNWCATHGSAQRHRYWGSITRVLSLDRMNPVSPRGLSCVGGFYSEQPKRVQ